MTTEISIIMPVYNSGLFLQDAIYSIANQSFSSFELICVDDASDDTETQRIIQKFESYSWFHVKHKASRKGAAQARNDGLKMATGEYVIFLDADDTFEKDLLQNMYTEIISTKSDVCLYGAEWLYIDGRIDVIIPGVIDKTKEDWMINVSTVPWDKLVKRKFLLNNKILFQNLSSSNDVYYSLLTYILSFNVAYYTEKPLVHYRLGYLNQISSMRDPRNVYYAAKKFLMR